MQSLEKEIKAIYTKLNSNVYKLTYSGQEQIFEESYLKNKFMSAFFVSDVKYQAPNNLIKEISITGDVELVKKIKDIELRRQAQGYISKAGATLSQIIKDNNQSSLTKVYKVLKNGLINGTSYAKQAKAIKSEFGKNAYNAIRVARTEGNRNASAGAYENTQDLIKQGINTRRQWIATLDDRTRDTHARLDGQFEDKNGLFWIGSDSARYPGDFANAGENINCRCTTIDVIDGVEPTLRRGINPVTGKSDIFSFKTYEEWKRGVVNAKPVGKVLPVAKTYDEAKTMLKNNVGFDLVEGSLDRIDKELAIDATNQLTKLEDKFGVVHKSHNSYIGSTSNKGSHAYVSSKATSPLEQGLTLCNPSYNSKIRMIEKELEAREKNWSMPFADNEANIYVVTHEYGHMVENSLFEQEMEKLGWDYANRMKFADFKKRTYSAQVKWYKNIRKNYSKQYNGEIVKIAKAQNPNFDLQANISDYGKSNAEEFFAEVFANSQLSKPNELGQAMNIWLKEKGVAK
jgi:SPP1 gp7 family putative phage head morphogenesis protein